jgi:chemotaxis protein MotB
MSAIKTIIVAFGVVLAAVIGYSFYLHFGPIQKISNENEQLKDEITQLRKASEESKTSCQAAIDEKIRRVKDLEKALSEIQQEKTTTRADLQEQIQGLKDQLAQREQDINTSRNEIENLQRTISDLKSSQESLNQKSTDLSNQLLESKNQLEGLYQQMAAKERQIAEITAARLGLIKQVDLLKEEKQGLGQKAMTLEKQLEQSREQLNSVSQAVASKENQLKIIAKTQEELEKHLQQQIQEKNLQISALEDKLKIQFLDKILFNPGNAVITAHGRKVLKNLAVELKKLQDIRLSVEGHTDNQPLSKESRAVYHDNLGLSTARAAAVSRTLRTLGVDPKLLSAAGYSMYRPVDSNATPEGQQLNRLVEIILLPTR